MTTVAPIDRASSNADVAKASVYCPVSNPFSTRFVRPGAIPFQFPDGFGAAELVERLTQLNWRAAIRGPHGTGKSTLLAALLPELERRGRIVLSFSLHDGQRRLPAELIAARLTADALVVIDGYEQLSRWSRFQLKRLVRKSDCGLLITSHAATRLPELYRTETDLRLAERLVELLAKPQRASIAREVIHREFMAHQGNLREMLFALYDEFELKNRSSLSNHTCIDLGGNQTTLKSR